MTIPLMSTEEEIPGNKLFLWADGLAGSAILSFAVIGMVCFLSRTPGSMLLAIAVAMAVTNIPMSIAFRKLRKAYEKKQEYLKAVRKENQTVLAFHHLFKPPQQQVYELFVRHQETIETAHRERVAFYGDTKEFVKDLPISGMDPEERGNRLSWEVDREGKRLEKCIEDLIAGFRYDRDICRKMGYQVHDSWKQYRPTELGEGK